MEQAGAARVLPDAELTPERLRAEIDALLDDAPRRTEMAAASRGSPGPTPRARSHARCCAAGEADRGSPAADTDDGRPPA